MFHLTAYTTLVKSLQLSLQLDSHVCCTFKRMVSILIERLLEGVLCYVDAYIHVLAHTHHDFVTRLGFQSGTLLRKLGFLTRRT